MTATAHDIPQIICPISTPSFPLVNVATVHPDRAPHACQVSEETRRITELLAQLPVEVDIEGLVQRALLNVRALKVPPIVPSKNGPGLTQGSLREREASLHQVVPSADSGTADASRGDSCSRLPLLSVGKSVASARDIRITSLSQSGAGRVKSIELSLNSASEGAPFVRSPTSQSAFSKAAY